MPDISINSLLIAFVLTLIAGFGTVVGALVSLLPQAREAKFLAGALGFSAGVMLYVSFLDLMPEALEQLEAVFSDREAHLLVTVAFFIGIALIWAIDFLIPEENNPHEYNRELKGADGVGRSRRAGLLLALAIGIHNFPEGMATFVSALDGAAVALPIVLAIMLHNIPEGIAVSVPVMHATGSRRKALFWSLLSGLAEPLGAIVGMLVLLPFWSPMVSSLLLSGVAGIMVYISLDELLPTAENHGHHHITILCLIAGMAVMALSML